jgi:hypothetical protein
MLPYFDYFSIYYFVFPRGLALFPGLVKALDEVREKNNRRRQSRRQQAFLHQVLATLRQFVSGMAGMGEAEGSRQHAYKCLERI